MTEYFIDKEVLDLTDKRAIYFVGDLHGDWDALSYFLKEVGFNYRDQLICVGDLMDRGAKNLEVLNYFMFTENAIAVRGNHEDMAILGMLNNEENQAASWIYNGGVWALDYPQDMMRGILRHLREKFPLALTVRYENITVGVVHAEAPTGDWRQFIDNQCQYYPWVNKAIWGRNRIKSQHHVHIKGVDHVISGHSVRSTVTTRGNHHWIDTGSVFDEGTGKYGLTTLELEPDSTFTEHRIVRDSWEQSGFRHVVKENAVKAVFK